MAKEKFQVLLDKNNFVTLVCEGHDAFSGENVINIEYDTNGKGYIDVIQRKYKIRKKQ